MLRRKSRLVRRPWQVAVPRRKISAKEVAWAVVSIGRRWMSTLCKTPNDSHILVLRTEVGRPTRSSNTRANRRCIIVDTSFRMDVGPGQEVHQQTQHRSRNAPGKHPCHGSIANSVVAKYPAAVDVMPGFSSNGPLCGNVMLIGSSGGPHIDDWISL